MILLLSLTACLFIMAICYDLRFHRIPNALCLIFFVTGCIANFFIFGWQGLANALLGAVVVFALLIPFFIIKTLGAGDIKLMMAVGALLGVSTTLWSVAWGVIVGGAIALLIAAPSLSWQRVKRTFVRYYHCLYLRTYLRPAANEIAAEKVPYAPALAAGFAITCYIDPAISRTLLTFFS